MVGTVGELVTCCTSQIMNDSLDGSTVSGLQIGHKLHDLLNGVSNIGAHHDCSVHKRADN